MISVLGSATYRRLTSLFKCSRIRETPANVLGRQAFNVVRVCDILLERLLGFGVEDHAVSIPNLYVYQLAQL